MSAVPTMSVQQYDNMGRSIPQASTSSTSLASQQAARNQQAMQDIQNVRGAFPSLYQGIQASPVSQSMNALAAQVAAKPTSIDDATRNAIASKQSDQLVQGYNQSKNQLASAMAAAGAGGSPAAMAKYAQMSGGLAGQLQGVQRDASVMQAQTNLSDQLRSLGALQGVQGQEANQAFSAGQGLINAVKETPLPNVAGEQQAVNAAGQYDAPTVSVAGDPNGIVAQSLQNYAKQRQGQVAATATKMPNLNQQVPTYG